MGVIRRLGIALGWASSVALAAVLSWVAINSAGQQVVHRAETGQASGGSVFNVATPMLGPATSATAPSSSPTPATTPEQPSLAEPPADGKASPSARASSVDSRGTGSGPSITAMSPPRSDAPVPVTGTMTIAAGSMWVECTGSSITSAWASPAEGWYGGPVRASNGGVTMLFRRGSRGIHLFAVCDGGRPRFDTHADDSPHDVDHDRQ